MSKACQHGFDHEIVCVGMKVVSLKVAQQKLQKSRKNNGKWESDYKYVGLPIRKLKTSNEDQIC